MHLASLAEVVGWYSLKCCNDACFSTVDFGRDKHGPLSSVLDIVFSPKKATWLLWSLHTAVGG